MPVCQLDWRTCWQSRSALRSCAAQDSIKGIKTVRIIPRTDAEVAAAHERARADYCEHVPAGEPVELSSFLLTYLSGPAGDKGELPIPMSRRTAFTVGLDMLDKDRANLPTLSKGKILQYLAEHYVCIEPRILKDLADGKLYFYHRPMAVTTTFTGARLSLEFTDLVSDAVFDMRSLGLLIDAGDASKPENLRNMLMVQKSMMASVDALGHEGKPKPTFEFAMICGRESPDKKDSLVLHAFATSHNRKQWHYLQPAASPSRADQCSICGSIWFTDYKVANLLPSASATRRLALRSKSTYTIEELDEYALSQGWKGGASTIWWQSLTVSSIARSR